MIDMHSRIVPGIEGGAITMKESVAISKIAIRDGIDTIIAVPRYVDGEIDNSAVLIMEQIKTLNKCLNDKLIPLTILPGQQVRLEENIVNGTLRDQLLPMNQTSTYLAVEMAPDYVPPTLKSMLFQLQIQRLTPIIVEPETHSVLQDNPNEIYRMVKDGALVQISAASIVGRNGAKARKLADQLIEANLAHLIASGIHDLKKQKFLLSDAYKQVEKRHGYSVTDFFHSNITRLVEGKFVISQEPRRVMSKKMLGFL